MINHFRYIGLYLLPTALITGPFLADLIVSLYALYFIYISALKRLYKYYNNYYFYIFFLFYVYILIRSLLSDLPLLSLESSLFYLRYYFFVACLVYLIDENKKIIFYFGIFTFIPILVLSIDSFIQLKTAYNIFGWKRPDSLHITSFFGSEMILGQYVVRIIPLLIATMLFYNYRKSTLSHIFAFSILVLSTTVTYISGERTAFFLSIFSFILFLILIRDFIRIRIFFFASLILMIVSISLIFPNTHNRIFNHTVTQMGFVDGNFYVFSKKHQVIYETSLQMFKDKPLFGYGPKMYREECKKYKTSLLNPCSTHSHNSYLQLLSETGIIGFTFFFLIFILIVKIITFHLLNIFKSNPDAKYLRSNYEISLLIGLLLTFFPFIPTMNIFNNWISIIYYLPVAFILKSSEDKKCL